MVAFEDFLLTGCFGTVCLGASESAVRDQFGDPEVHTPRRKSYPAMLVYGNVEFRLRRDQLAAISLTLDPEVYEPPHLIPISGMFNKQQRSIGAIERLLDANDICYAIDRVMSDENQTVLVTDRGVHLAFSSDGLLGKVAALSDRKPGDS